MRGGVYYITNSVSGVVYVGKSINLKQRFRRHRYRLNRGTHANPHLTTGGEGARHSPESRAKIGRTRKEKGIRHTSETVEKIAAQNRGRPLTSEHKAKLIANSFWRGKKRPPLTPERIARLREVNRGKPGHPHTEESKEKIRRAKLGHVVTPETRRKISETKRLKRLSQIAALNVTG